MRNQIDVLDKGYVKLVGVMTDFEDLAEVIVAQAEDDGGEKFAMTAVPENLTFDAQIARAARVSYQEGTAQARSDAGLIDYLMRHRHTSPFEQVSFKFQLKMPLFVAQQWIRHRTAKLNQESARYSVIRDEFYVPDEDRIQGQHESNKQGSGDALDDLARSTTRWSIRMASGDSFDEYREMLDLGVARELARTVLPVGTYTSMVWQMDLHNLMHFLSLRMDEHAQWETRQYAQALYDLVQPLVPLAFSSFRNHVLDAVTFSADEVALIREAIETAYESFNEDTRKSEFVEELVDELSKIGLNASRRREFLNKIGDPE